MEEKRCAHCGCPLDLNPRSKNQRYCGKKECQRARKRLWQKAKMATDPDYRANQRECNKDWRDRNPDYWRDYRKSHPGYAERNRLLQKARRAGGNASIFATEASVADFLGGARNFWIIPEGRVAKMDAFPLKVTMFPAI